MALPAGFPPASFRLEDGCLVCSATAAFENGQRGRNCTCDPSGPSRVRWLLRYALSRPDVERDRGGRIARPKILVIGFAVRLKLADPKGVAPSTLPQTTGRSAD